MPDRHAAITAEILTAASLRGVDTHGVGNVVGYVQAIEQGVYTIPQMVEMVSESADDRAVGLRQWAGLCGDAPVSI